MSWKLNKNQADFFKQVVVERKKTGKPFVLWGWKRDKVVRGKRYPESRTVYFSADLALGKKLTIFIKRAYFFLELRDKEDEIRKLVRLIGPSRNLSAGRRMKIRYWSDYNHSGYQHLRLQVGEPASYDFKTVKRRLKGKPRLFIKPVKLISPSKNYDISRFAPLAVYCGSGLSAESGLPLLGSIHQVFSVDDNRKEELVFAQNDPLPGRLVKNPSLEFEKFCQFDIEALKAEPSASHLLIKSLYKKGIIKQVFTDNVDDIFKKIKVPFTQVRESIFPDRYPVRFQKEVGGLLVIGISVDRREVIKQARRKGLKIIAINPVMGVAPHSRNIDYLYKGDIYYKDKAKNMLVKIVDKSGFKFSNRETILLTGSRGFIGSRTAEELKKNGFRIKPFTGDVRKLNDWIKNLESCQLVFHLAGIRTETKKDFAVNAQGTENLFQAISKTGKKPLKIILASSAAVYRGNRVPFKEIYKPRPATIYGQSKLEAENTARNYCRKLKIPLVILRYSGVLGPGIRPQSRMSWPLPLWLANGRAGRPIVVNLGGRQTRDYVHIDDVVRVNLLAIQLLGSGSCLLSSPVVTHGGGPDGVPPSDATPRNSDKMKLFMEIYNVGGGRPIRLLDLAHWVWEATGKKSKIVIRHNKPSVKDPMVMFSDISKIKTCGWSPKKVVSCKL